MIDNFEEVNQRIEDEDKPVLKAKIEKSIYDWATTFGSPPLPSAISNPACADLYFS